MKPHLKDSDRNVVFIYAQLNVKVILCSFGACTCVSCSPYSETLETPGIPSDTSSFSVKYSIIPVMNPPLRQSRSGLTDSLKGGLL